MFDYDVVMFEALLENCIGSTDAELDERLRANELAARRLAAERSALVAVIEHRGRSVPSTARWRATCGRR